MVTHRPVPTLQEHRVYLSYVADAAIIHRLLFLFQKFSQLLHLLLKDCNLLAQKSIVVPQIVLLGGALLLTTHANRQLIDGEIRGHCLHYAACG